MKLRLPCRLLLASTIVTGAMLAGCGPQQTTVTGTVTLGDKPLPRATISFTPREGAGEAAFAQSDEQGSYVAEFAKGQIAGDAATFDVRITTFDPGESRVDPPIPRIPERVPARYNEKTELTAVIEPGENRVDFPLDVHGPVIQPDRDERGR